MRVAIVLAAVLAAGCFKGPASPDAVTGKPFTLDGVFGMNFMVASANVTGGALPDIDKIAGGPFQFVVVDHVRGTLGFK